jgi:predicted ATP-dependent endonuclease of OLD family
MRLNKIHIENYRGLDEVDITFVDNLICIVGRNDVGKSSVIKAVETFFSQRNFTDKDFPFDSPQDIITEITIHFEVSQKVAQLEPYLLENQLIIKQKFQKGEKNPIKTYECFKEFNIQSSNKPTNYVDYKKIGSEIGIKFPNKKPSSEDETNKLFKMVDDKLKELEGKPIWVNIDKDWKAISAFLPEVITIPAAQDPESEQKMTSDSSAFGKLFRVGIRKLLVHDSEGRKAAKLVSKKVEEINKRILDIVEEKLREQGNTFNILQTPDPLDVSKSFSFTMDIQDEYGIITPLSQRGNGLQRSVLIAIVRAQSDINKLINKLEKEQKQESGNKWNDQREETIYLIEEPEAFLHVSAQRDLYYSIKDLIKDGGQALITTHSTLFMDEGDLDQVVLLNREDGKTVSLQSIPPTEIREEIGEIIKVSELMTGKVCCLLEGIADCNAFYQWMKILGYDSKELGIYFIDMKGCKNAEYYANVKVIKDFRVKFMIVLDTDHHNPEASVEKKRILINEYKVPENLIHILRKGEIENYFPIPLIEKVLKFNKGSINHEVFKKDAKQAIQNAKELTGGIAMNYKENRDSRRITMEMKKEEIDNEIVGIIQKLVKLAGGNVIE